jgi:hypothetical protein
MDEGAVLAYVPTCLLSMSPTNLVFVSKFGIASGTAVHVTDKKASVVDSHFSASASKEVGVKGVSKGPELVPSVDVSFSGFVVLMRCCFFIG